MEKRNTKKRAFTLAELAVVLAVIAIAATMVVTFTSLVSNRRAEAQARLDALNDIKVAEALIENYIEKNGLDVDENGKSTEITYSTENGLNVNGKEQKLERVTDISFKDSNKVSGNTLYYCTVTYEVADKEDTYTFCVLHKEDGGSNP